MSASPQERTFRQRRSGEPPPTFLLLAPGHDAGRLGQSPRRALGLKLGRDPLGIMDGQPLRRLVMLAGDPLGAAIGGEAGRHVARISSEMRLHRQ